MSQLPWLDEVGGRGDRERLLFQSLRLSPSPAHPRHHRHVVRERPSGLGSYCNGPLISLGVLSEALCTGYSKDNWLSKFKSL